MRVLIFVSYNFCGVLWDNYFAGTIFFADREKKPQKFKYCYTVSRLLKPKTLFLLLSPALYFFPIFKPTFVFLGTGDAMTRFQDISLKGLGGARKGKGPGNEIIMYPPKTAND